MELTFIVNGDTTVVTAQPGETLAEAKARALKVSGNTGRPVADWEVRNIEGQALDQTLAIDALGIADGERLFVQLQLAGCFCCHGTTVTEIEIPTTELPLCEGCGQVPTRFSVWDDPSLRPLREAMLKIDGGQETIASVDGEPEYRCGCATLTAEQYLRYNEQERQKRAELGFVLRVHYGDNDCAWPIERACQDFYQEVTRGFLNSHGIELALQLIDEVGLENVRRSIVLCAVGHYIAMRAKRWHLQLKYGDDRDLYRLDQYQDTLKYLDRNVEIKKLPDYVKEWENSETCYIDFTRREVLVQ